MWVFYLAFLGSALLIFGPVFAFALAGNKEYRKNALKFGLTTAFVGALICTGVRVYIENHPEAKELIAVKRDEARNP